MLHKRNSTSVLTDCILAFRLTGVGFSTGKKYYKIVNFRKCLAERKGFEPLVRFDPNTRFPSEPVKPLLHLSKLLSKVNYILINV